MRALHAQIVALMLLVVTAPALWADDYGWEERVLEAHDAENYGVLRSLYDERFPNRRPDEEKHFEELTKQKNLGSILDLLTRSGDYSNSITAPAGANPASKNGLAQRLEKRGITLRRSISGKDVGKGALFSYQRDFMDDNDIFTTRFALKWQRKRPWVGRGGRTFWRPTASVSGVLTSEKKDQVDDSWIFYAGVDGDREAAEWNGKAIKSRADWWWSAGARYELSQDRKTRKLMIDGALEPAIHSIGMGYVRRCGKCARFSWRWQPTGLFDVGHTLKRGASTEVDDTILRLGLGFRAELFLDGLSRRLGIYDPRGPEGDGDVPWFLPYLWVGNTVRYTPLEGRDWRNILRAGFVLPLTPNASFDFDYRYGRDVPDFEKISLFTIGFGLKF